MKPTWLLEEAVALARKVEIETVLAGWHCGLGGSTLHKGCSYKDVDLILFSPLPQRLPPPSSEWAPCRAAQSWWPDVAQLRGDEAPLEESGLQGPKARRGLDVRLQARGCFGARVSWQAWFEVWRRERAALTFALANAMLRPCPSDRQYSPASPATAPSLCHYIIVRADLPHGSQVAQTVHAAGESARPRPSPGCIAVALHARDQAHLLEIGAALDAAGITSYAVFEGDDDKNYAGQLMAIGLAPTTDRAAVRKVLSSLPLVR